MTAVAPAPGVAIVFERRSIKIPTKWFKKAKVTQAEVARELGVSHHTLMGWIYKDYGFPYAVWLAMVDRWGDQGYEALDVAVLSKGFSLMAAKFGKYIEPDPTAADLAITLSKAQETPKADVKSQGTPQAAVPAVLDGTRPETWPQWFHDSMAMLYGLVAKITTERNDVLREFDALRTKHEQVLQETIKLAQEVDTQRGEKDAALQLALELQEQVEKLQREAYRPQGGRQLSTEGVAAVQAIAAAQTAAGKVAHSPDLKERLGK